MRPGNSGETLEDQVETVQETLSEEDESSALRRSIYTVVVLTAGGYLAAKLRSVL
jgi:hypothetical protein